MRKILLIFIAILSVGYARAQRMWSSADGYSQYVTIEFEESDLNPVMLGDRQRPMLDYLSDVVRSTIDKINSEQYRVWVESYLHIEGKSVRENLALARIMSNTLKGHLIVTNGLTEDDFSTRNFSGTFDNMPATTVVVIGFRYPIEQLLPKQRLDDQGLYMYLSNLDTLSTAIVDTQLLVANIGVDTSAILSPEFKVLTFNNSADALAPPIEFKSRSKTVAMTDDSSLLLPIHDDAPSVVLFAPSSSQQSQSSSASNASETSIGKKQDTVFQLIVPSPLSASQFDRQSDQTSAQNFATHANTNDVASTSSSAERLRLDVVVPTVSSTSGQIAQFIDQPGVAKSGPKSKAELAKQKREQRLAEKQAASVQSSTRKNKKTDGQSQSITADDLSALSPEQRIAMDKAAADADPANRSKQSNSSTAGKSTVQTKRGKKAEIAVDESNGQLKIDASAFEQSLNKEVVAKQQATERAQRVKEQQALREIVAQREMQKRRQIRLSRERFAVCGIGLNALTAAVLTPSVQLDAYFSDRLSVAAEWYYSKWNFDQTNIFNISMASLELRYFVMGKKKAFEGLYVGLYGSMGEYDFRWNSSSGRQSAFITAGLSVGYVLPIGKSGFYLEAGLSAGYVMENVEPYLNYNGNYIRTGEKFKNSTIFAPTKIKVSFIYRLFNKRKTRD